MEGMHSMSHLMFNQVEQIADVKTCNIDNIEHRYYKVQWKCTWEPAIVLERFCGKIIADYKKGPNSCKNQIETAEKTKRHNVTEDSGSINLGEPPVYVIENYEGTQHFEDTCILFSSSNKYKESLLQSDNIKGHVRHSQMSSDPFNKEPDEIYSTNEVQNVINVILPATNNKLNNKLVLHNFDIKPDPDNEVFPNINILNENDNTSFKHAITAEESSFNHANTAEESSFNLANIAEESSTTNNDQSNELSLTLNSPDLMTESSNSFSKNIILKNSTASTSNRRRNRTNLLSRHCFRCHLCSYFSPKSSNLKRHMLKHTGEKPFKCSLCSYSASQKSNINAHMTKHTREFKCHLCSFSTTDYTSIKYHLMTHADDETKSMEQ